MSLSTLPLSYCTNVHPGRTLDEVIHGLQQHTVPARQQLGDPIAAGLWLANSVVQEIDADPGSIRRLQEVLAAGGLCCYTLNAFPFGDFHSERVKEQVYLPDWSSPDRLRYTLQCARVLAELLPPGTEGSLSTVPLGFKGLTQPADFRQACIRQLLELVRQLDQLHDERGQVLRLAIEPEPRCLLETTPEAIHFLQETFAAAEEAQLLDQARRHLGICYDVCHQAVEFEDIAASIAQLHAAEIRINKVHLTCALHLDRPGERPEARQELAAFVEPRYLHQTFAARADGSVVSCDDLTPALCTNPPEDYRSAKAWRVHFHVPVHRESLGGLQTTRDALRAALSAVRELPYAPHLEVETYTWGVLPGDQAETLAAGLVKELSATRELMQS